MKHPSGTRRFCAYCGRIAQRGAAACRHHRHLLANDPYYNGDVNEQALPTMRAELAVAVSPPREQGR